MGVPQLADLLTIPVQDDVLNQEVLPELQRRGLRVSDWFVGGVYRSMSMVVSLMRMNSRVALAALAAAGFEDYAFGFTPVPGGIDVTGWAPIIAQQRYGVVQIAASYTRRTITLTNASATPYGPLQPGAIILSIAATGNRYVLDQVVTIPASGSVTATFRSEFTNNSGAGLNYNDPPGSTLAFVTASYAGVTATNPAPSYYPVAQTGTGLGTITPSGAPTGSHNVTVRIDAQGTVAGATVGWSASVDGGAFATQSGSTATNLGGFGINLTLADNGGNPSFFVGTYFYIQTPGSDITQQGSDVETPQALGTRCRGLWPSLAFAKDSLGNWIPMSPTASAYLTLALSSNSNVKIALVKTDGTINNKLLIYIAGTGGAPSTPATIANVQAFFNVWSMLTDLPLVQTSTSQAITLGGLTISVPSAQAAAAKVAMQKRLQLYFGGLDTSNPITINSLLDHAYIASLIRTTGGVSKITDEAMTINGVAADFDLSVGGTAFQSASWTQQVATAFTWLTT